MILTIFEGNRCTSMTLPDCAEGRHLIRRPSDDEPLLMAVGTPEGWSLVEMGARLLNAPTRLESQMLLKALCRKDQQLVTIYAEKKTEDRQKYAYIMIPAQLSLKVGANAGCDIVYDDPHVARHHLTLRYDGKAWSATVERDAAHIYVNGRLFEGGSLHMGDMLFLMGLRLIFLPGILCCNCPDGRVRVTNKTLRKIDAPEVDKTEYYRQAPLRAYFNRMPRFVKTMEEEKLNVDAPPAQQAMQQQSALLQMGPALTSGLFAMLGGMASMMSVGMMASNLIFPSIGRKKMIERQEAYEKRRQEAYRAYLDQLEAKLTDMAQSQLRQLQKQLPSAVETARQLMKDHRHLWDRRRSQEDSMQLRLGEGSWPLKCDITLPPQHFDLTDDPMRAMLDEMRQKKRVLNHAPIGVDLKKYNRIGIAGSGADVQRLLWQLLVQLTTQLGYDEVKLCVMGTLPRALRPFTRLPHTWSDDGRHHFLAETETEVNEVSQVLEGMLALRRSDMQKEEIDRLPRLVVLITETEWSQRGVLHRQLLEKKYPGVHVISLGKHTSDLPRQSELVVGVRGDKGELISSEGERLSFTMDGTDMDLTRPLVSLMENTLLDMPDTDSRLPEVVPFLQMFGVNQVEELNLMSRYFRNDPARTLAVPIGVDASGETCYLDMHENAQCFHGLIAGTTGSGKSELIMALILSLACCFSPEQVNFALIDFKGGSTAQAFQKLPHTVGVLTNLEGSNVNRALKSIKSELVRRQTIFDRIKQIKNKTKININDYQRMYSGGELKEPLPHLFLIVDEFAELKSQQPEFMDELVSTAHIGRELGVHLILATQKPAGVINDQIESNVGLYICLRVQSTQDSQDVLKCPDAAMLTGVGRFYMKRNNALTLAQSAYTGAPYINVAEAMNRCVVEVVDRTGYVLRTKNIDNNNPRNAKTQLAAVVDYICDTAKRARFITQPLWQPPLEPQVLAVLQKQYPRTADPWELAALIGEADDPANQRRIPVRLSLNTGRSTMIYGALGSGKTMTLMAMMQDLLSSHTPKELNAYVLDYMNEGLGVLKAAPHVGDVIGEMEDEKLQRLLTMLEKEIDRRKQLMGGMLMAGGVPQRLRRAELCSILVVIHGMPMLQNKMGNDLARLVQLLSIGPQYGVCFVATMPMANGLSFQLALHFSQQIVLQMPHDDDYAMLLGRVGSMRPGAVRGRGLLRMEEQLYEFQTATPQEDVGNFCQSLAAAWQGEKAKLVGIDLMPKRVDAALLAQSLDISQPIQLPIGLDGDSFEPVMIQMDKKPVHQVIGESSDAAAFCRSLAMLAAMQGVEAVILDAAGQLGAVPGVRVLAGNAIGDFVDDMFMWAVNVKKGLAKPEMRRLVLVTDAFALMKQLQAIEKEEEVDGVAITSWTLMSSLLTKANPQWQISFVVCASGAKMSGLKVQEWYTTQLDSGNGLWLGGGLKSDSALKANSGIAPGPQAFPWGYVVTNGKAQQVRFAAEEVEQG